MLLLRKQYATRQTNECPNHHHHQRMAFTIAPRWLHCELNAGPFGDLVRVRCTFDATFAADWNVKCLPLKVLLPHLAHEKKKKKKKKMS